MYKTNRDLTGFFKTFPRADDGTEIRLPNVLMDQIQPTIDAGSYEEQLVDFEDPTLGVQTRIQVAVGAAINVSSVVVPRNRYQIVVAAHARSLQAVPVDRALRIGVNTPLGVLTIAHGTFSSAFADVFVPVQRSFIVPQLQQVTVSVSPAHIAGDNLQLMFRFVERPVSDTLPLPALP